MTHELDDLRLPPLVPLFALPNVVLFPRAVLPLHIFEERYKAMTADVLRTHRQIAMALLQPGWEMNYYCRPGVDPVVCVGTIVSHERLADGEYNLLLRGHTRARILREQRTDSYRLAELQPLQESPVLEIDLDDQRQQLTRIFAHGPLSRTMLACQFQRLLTSPLPTADVADLIAFTFLEDVQLKQSLLADTDIRRRVQRVVAALASSDLLLKWAAAPALGQPSLN